MVQSGHGSDNWLSVGSESSVEIIALGKSPNAVADPESGFTTVVGAGRRPLELRGRVRSSAKPAFGRECTCGLQLVTGCSPCSK